MEVNWNVLNQKPGLRILFSSSPLSQKAAQSESEKPTGWVFKPIGIVSNENSPEEFLLFWTDLEVNQEKSSHLKLMHNELVESGLSFKIKMDKGSETIVKPHMGIITRLI